MQKPASAPIDALATVDPAGAPAPSSPSSTRGQLEHRYSRLGLDLLKLVPSAKGTIVDPPAGALHDLSTIEGGVAGSDRTLDSEPPPHQQSVAPAPSTRTVMEGLDSTAIVLGPVVGTGGMGIVNVAEQPALKREVAVKRLRPERQNLGAIDALLREAWVTGTLEHPNIVPIHLLLADQGAPRVVMKRIEGMTWDALLDSPKLAEEFGAAPERDKLLFHLRILMEVCRAVQFAHARGVLHLDLKPENVMVGRFGEVYVVDWGIAASLPDVGPAWLPPTTEIRSVRGTPSWMPPELATAEGDKVGVATDVYLLGGLLHAILTDNGPRHTGREMIDLLAAAFDSHPFPYPASVPGELAAIANRATSKKPEDRYATAEAFRRAIEGFLEHRHSTELSDKAAARMETLIAFFERTSVGPGEGTQAGQSLRRDFLECRFGFRQALDIWPENQRAREGLQRVLRAMAGYALANEQLERAAESTAELSPRDPELDRRVKALQTELSQRHERLAQFERDASLDTFREKRSQWCMLGALSFLVWNIPAGLMHRSGTFVFDLVDLCLYNGITFVILLAASYLVRKTLMTTKTNRRLYVLLVAGFIAIQCFWLAAYVHSTVRPEHALTATEVVSLTLWCALFYQLAVGLTIDARALWIIPPVAAIAICAPLAEKYAFELMGLEGFMCGAWLAWIWRRPAKTRGKTQPVSPMSADSTWT